MRYWARFDADFSFTAYHYIRENAHFYLLSIFLVGSEVYSQPPPNAFAQNAPQARNAPSEPLSVFAHFLVRQLNRKNMNPNH